MTRFDAAFRWILKAEGGYVHDPSDPGGETNMGISKRAYPSEDIAGMTETRAREIYHRDYWKPCRCDELPPGVDLIVFDGGVLMGTQTVIRQLQRAIEVKDDGVIGPATLKAASARGAARIPHLLTERILYMTGLSVWKHYGRGWTLRTMRLMEAADADV